MSEVKAIPEHTSHMCVSYLLTVNPEFNSCASMGVVETRTQKKPFLLLKFRPENRDFIGYIIVVVGGFEILHFEGPF